MTARISAIVTAYQRVEQTLSTLQRLYDCVPPPSEVIVHVDGGQTECKAAILAAFPNTKVLQSESRVGPGGGRNKLVAAASNEIVASFDDDSFPVDADYFARAQTLCAQFPDAAVLGAIIYERGEPLGCESKQTVRVSDFGGGACIYRKSSFLATGGYVPLPVAYGMEEVDFALRLHAGDNKILRSNWLRVFHDADLRRHADPETTAASIANLALLTFLRYPIYLWWVGVVQIMNRICWLAQNRRWHGILEGIAIIPSHLRANRQYRSRLPARSVLSFFALRRRPAASRGVGVA